METYQLKRIIIIILALVNLSLLGLLGRSVLQQRQAEQQTLLQLKDLYLTSGISLTLAELPRNQNQNSANVQHDAKGEQTFAEAFLGESEIQESGSVMQYSSALGTMRLRRNSAFELHMDQAQLTEDECVALLERFGYSLLPDHPADRSTLYLVQTISDTPVVGAVTTLHFSGGYLSSADGYYIAGLQETGSLSCCSAADALSALLQYSQDTGASLGTVTDIVPAWYLTAETLFQSSVQPAWLIQTNAASYYVNHDSSVISPVFSEVF